LGAYSGLLFYRPRTPPRVTGRSLAELVNGHRALGVAVESGPIGMSLKFGAAIDQDERPTTWDEPIDESGTIRVSREIEWDVRRDCDSLSALVEALATQDESIYRAHLMLGSVADPVRACLAGPETPEADAGPGFDVWSFSIEPIQSYDPETEEPFWVGWMAVSLSGFGTFYPHSPREFVDRAGTHQGIRGLTDLCRRLWPVEPGRPERTIQKLRQRMGALWPYARTDLPWDWYWGGFESD
jgi:hypothetical protein